MGLKSTKFVALLLFLEMIFLFNFLPFTFMGESFLKETTLKAKPTLEIKKGQNHKTRQNLMKLLQITQFFVLF